jgi:hypothetical protein
MEPGKDEPFDRAPWRRLLGAESGAPSRDVDRRILAESRRTLAPHIARWWLPASLAASLLLAVLLVQRQLAVAPAPLSESDVVMPPAPAAADAGGNAAAPSATTEFPAQKQDEPAVPAPSVAPPLIDVPTKELRSAPAAESPAPEPALLAPAPARQESVLEREQASFAKSTAAVPAAMPRPPEEWYAEIQRLRAAGHVSEADQELARFKAAYPGWLEQHDRKDP